MPAIVSVIMATKNSGSTIEFALRSLEQQTQSSLELIVIDSVSKDNTVELVHQSRVKHTLVSEQDNNIYEALNKGLDLASGDWIMFLGSDDEYFSRESIEQLISSPDNADLLYGYAMANNELLVNTFDWRMLKGNSMNHQSIAYRRTVFEKYRYDTSYKIGADYKLNLELYLAGVKSKNMKTIVVNYGTKGISNRLMDRGLCEQDHIRIELLGHGFGMIINNIQRMKRVVRNGK